MALKMIRNWWVLVLRGAISVVFGLIVFAYPAMTLLLLVTIFGVYALVEGGARFIGAFTGGDEGNRWGLIATGVLGVAFGLLTLFYPAITVTALIYIIAAHAILNGIYEIVVAVQLRREIEGEWVLAISGLISITFGVLVALRPAMGVVTVALVIGIYAVLLGISQIVIGIRLRGVKQKLAEIKDTVTA